MKTPLWLNPAAIGILWIAIVFFAWTAPDAIYFSIMRTSKYVDTATVVTSSLMIFAFIAGSLTGSASSSARPWHPGALQDSTAALRSPGIVNLVYVSFVLMFVAYIVAFAPSFSLAGLISRFQADSYHAKTDTAIAGLTTFTQLGLLIVGYTSVMLFSDADIPAARRRHFKFMLMLTVLLATYRSFIWNERLALIELLVPLGIVYVVFRVKNKLVLSFGPFVMFIVVLTLFGSFEYFRSWHVYRDQFDNIAIFSFQRFLSYYYSSINNFGMALQYIEPFWQPSWTLDFLYRFPIPGNPLLEVKAEQLMFLFVEILSLHTHAEFNLYSAPGFAYLDFGVIGGSLCLFFFGFLSGRLFNAFRRFSVHGLIIFPVWMVGMMDFGRILYWPQSRTFPFWLAVIAIILVHNQYVRRRR